MIKVENNDNNGINGKKIVADNDTFTTIFIVITTTAATTHASTNISR